MQDATGTIRIGNRQRSGCCRRWLGQPALETGLVLMLSAVGARGGAATRPAERTPSDPDEVIVQLMPSAVVLGEQITLGDLAEIRGDSGQTAARWPIMLSPRPGSSCTIDLATIQKALADREANLAYWVFRGSSRCTVSRPAASAADHKKAVSGSQARPGRGEAGTSLADSRGRTDPMDPALLVDQNTLGGVLYQHIRNHLIQIGGIPTVEFPRTITRQLALSRPTYDFVIADRSDHLLGLVPMDVTIVDRNGDRQLLQVLAKVALRKAVVVAARPINRNQTVESADLTLQEEVFERIEDIALTETAPAVGQRAKRFIDKGEQIQARDLEPAPLVHRNDLVTVLISRGNLRIRGTARSLGTGGYGDMVEVKNEMAGRSSTKFQAVVIGDKTVEVPGGDRPTTTAPASFGRKGS
jgi:flagella basal body P-ring formation protein FlgA